MEKLVFKVAFAVAFAACSQAFAQADARAAYQQRQAIQEVQRLSSQFDQLQNGMESLSSRMSRIESSNTSGDLKAEIGALRSELNEVRRRQDALRGEIVAELSKKMADLIAKSRPPAPPPAAVSHTRKSATQAAPQEAAPSGPTGPYFEHVVESGETLSYIAKECKTTVQKIKQYSGIKSDNLRVGQKLLIPAEEEKK